MITGRAADVIPHRIKSMILIHIFLKKAKVSLISFWGQRISMNEDPQKKKIKNDSLPLTHHKNLVMDSNDKVG
jgi:hypothetical protein